MAREYFKVFHSCLKSIEPLNDTERGRLFTAMLEYSITGEDPDLRGNERFIFPTMKANIDREVDSYRRTVEKNSANGHKGGRPKGKPTESEKTHWVFEKPTKTQKSQDKEEDKEEDKEDKKESVKRKAAARFSPPTLEEVEAYCIERENSVDAHKFVDYYTANGWRVGKNPMKDWMAAVRTWEKNEYSTKPDNVYGNSGDGWDYIQAVAEGRST